MSRQKKPWGVVALIATAALIGACGSATPAQNGASAGSGGGGSSTSAKAHQAVRFARCMRNNGVSQFPDPPASGNFTIDQMANGSSLNTTSPSFTQALSACKDLEPAGFTGSKRSSKQQSAARQFAACMRKNGVPDFPDPTANSPLIDTNNIPSANQPGGMSALKAAKDKCSSLAVEVIGRQP